MTEELARGRKTSHWMWFVFPQVAELGQSEMARRFAIGSLEEARAYVEHTVLGVRLRECTRLVIAAGRPVETIFGYPDELKFGSSMTLFAKVDKGDSSTAEDRVFQEALRVCFMGEQDGATLRILSAWEQGRTG